MTVTQSSTPAQSAAPAPDRPRTWVRRIVGGGQTVEACPASCRVDHRTDRLGNLDDLLHAGPVTEMFVNTVDHWSNGEPVTLPLPILRADIRVEPYSENPKRRMPFATFEPSQDEIVDELGPEELAAIVTQIREHCDRLDQVVADLRVARAEHGVGA